MGGNSYSGSYHIAGAIESISDQQKKEKGNQEDKPLDSLFTLMSSSRWVARYLTRFPAWVEHSDPWCNPPTTKESLLLAAEPPIILLAVGTGV